MNNNYSIQDKTIIKCVYCLNRLRVPTDKGKISVVCSVCKKEFVYNPNSILDTIKQIALSMKSKLPENRRKLAIFLIAAVILLTVLLFLLFNPFTRKDTEKIPGPMVYNMQQEYFMDSWDAN